MAEGEQDCCDCRSCKHAGLLLQVMVPRTCRQQVLYVSDGEGMVMAEEKREV